MYRVYVYIRLRSIHSTKKKKARSWHTLRLLYVQIIEVEIECGHGPGNLGSTC